MGPFINIQFLPMEVKSAINFSAILLRQKGKDFYDAIFLLSKIMFNIDILKSRVGISFIKELKIAEAYKQKKVDLNKKKRDFICLLLNDASAERIQSSEKDISNLTTFF